MSLLNLHTRVGICRNGNKTHLEKALSFPDFRAQSEYSPVRENGSVQLCFLQWWLAPPQKLMFEDVWLLVNSYLFQNKEKETGAELMSRTPSLAQS